MVDYVLNAKARNEVGRADSAAVYPALVKHCADGFFVTDPPNGFGQHLSQ